MKKWIVYKDTKTFDTEEEATDYIFSLQDDPDAYWEELCMMEIEIEI